MEFHLVALHVEFVLKTVQTMQYLKTAMADMWWTGQNVMDAECVCTTVLQIILK